MVLQTLALFSGGVYLSKMQKAGYNLENVTLLSHQELSYAPEGPQAVCKAILCPSHARDIMNDV